MENSEYIMVGSPTITRELFRKVLIPLNNYDFKPSGGFWSSKYINHMGISDWFTFLLDARSIARYKDLNQSIIFTLKENTKILTIDTPEKVLELAVKYPSYHHTLGFYDQITENNTTFDFQKLSQDYDAVYINFNFFANQFKTMIFDKYGANSLLLFNLDCIKEYRTAPIIFDIDDPYSFPYINRNSIGATQKVEEESNEHKLLAELTKEIYLSLINKYINYTFEDYDEYLTIITKNTSTVMKIIEAKEDKNLNEILKNLEDKKMYIRKGQLVQNIVLNFISEYLLQDEERIKSLPKSKIRTPKTYSIL